MQFEQITVIGVGLIGGSIGLAAKSRRLARRIVGVGRDREKLEISIRLGIIDTAETEIAPGVAHADAIVVCTPVDRIAGTIASSLEYCRAGTLITDAGSTKGNIVRELAGVTDTRWYVPSHPLAGSEKSGPEHAHADLFNDRMTILTPHAGTDPIAIDRALAFWRGLGSRTFRMTPEDHDRALATTSHLPHAVAAAVASATPLNWLTLTAGGFRDVTRIAGGDIKMWTAIFLANRDAVLEATQTFTQRMDEFRQRLEDGDRAALANWLAEAKQVRDALGT